MPAHSMYSMKICWSDKQRIMDEYTHTYVESQRSAAYDYNTQFMLSTNW